MQGHCSGQSQASHFRIRCTRSRGSPRGKWIREATCRKQAGRKEVVPVGRRLLMGQGQLLSQGLCTERQLCLPPSCCREARPPRPCGVRQHPIPTGSGFYLKFTWSPKKLGGGTKHTTKTNSQQQNLNCKFPKEAVTSMPTSSSPTLSLRSGPSAGVHPPFAAMTCRCAAPLADSPPPLSKKADRERKGEEMTSQDCVPWPAHGRGRE